MLETMLKMLIAQLPPGTLESIAALAQEWKEYQILTRQKLGYLESKAESADNRLTYLCNASDDINEKLILIMAESNITPTLQNEVLAMAQADPRNYPTTENVK